ncbi:MAG: hypothetical protein ACE5KK_07875 [Candidatus Brocadiales bacterium]
MGNKPRQPSATINQCPTEEIVTGMEHFFGDRALKLLSRAKGRPYLYLSLTPVDVDGGDDIVDVANPGVIDLLRNPPNYREGGWNIYRTEPRHTPDGLVSEFEVATLRDTQRLELLKNGHLELSIKIDQRRFDIEYVRKDGQNHPTLYLYPLCEIPLNFLRLCKDIRQEYKTDSLAIIRMGLYNISGYSLCAYGKNTEGYKRQWEEGNFPLWEEDHLILSTIKASTGFEPGQLAKRLAEDLWSKFGFEDPPPLFDEQGGFRP